MASSMRRPRNSLTNHKQISLLMAIPTSEKLTALADRAGVNRSVMVEQLIEHVELDANGVPTWWPEEHYPEQEAQLPMTS